MSTDWVPEELVQPKYRPPVSKGETDFVKATLAVADAARICERVAIAFKASQEIDDLRCAYEDEVPVELQISSSLKYTRFKFPNVRHLGAKIAGILREERCELIGRQSKYYDTIELAVPRLGCCDMVIRYGEERD